MTFENVHQSDCEVFPGVVRYVPSRHPQKSVCHIYYIAKFSISAFDEVCLTGIACNHHILAGSAGKSGILHHKIEFGADCSKYFTYWAVSARVWVQ